MSVSPDQLGGIYRSLRQTFHDHPAVSIKPLKGDPPEQYEILYTISGYCKTGRSEVRLEQEHRIELTIPFGFPHFPPSCKPKTDIFHPDFDPAAVCLGDFWQPGREVTELVIHIGRLINGEMYSSENAFNEEAVTWYLEHSNLFPLGSIPWTSGVLPRELESGSSVPQIDTIEEEDLLSDFDLLSLESDSVEAPIAPSPVSKGKTPLTKEDLAYLQLLRSRKKFFKLRQLLTTTPPSSAEAEQLLILCSEEIGKAEELYQSAQQVETAGNLKNAARMFLEVSGIVNDFPNLGDDLRRTEAALASAQNNRGLATDFGNGELTSGDIDEPGPPSPKVSKAGNAAKIRPASPKVAVKRNFLQTKTILLLASICIVLIFGGYFGIRLYGSQLLQQAESELASCNASLAKNAFEDAQRACNLALQKSTPAFGLQKAESEALITKINEILSSEQFRQGLAGNVLVNGKYLPKKDAMALEEFNRLQKEAETLFSQQQWSDAEDRYKKLLAHAERHANSFPNADKEIKKKLEYLRFSKMFGNANALVAESKWQEATIALQKAKTLLDTLSEDDRRRHEPELNAALAKCNFEEFRQLGNDFFSKSDWSKAITTYKAALPSAESNKLASPEHLHELRENIARAELYAAIDAGNKAFAAANWEEAILEYKQAGNILNSQLESIKTVDGQFTRKKLDRIILQTIVIRDRQTAQSAEMDNQDLVSARNIYRRLVTTLSNSGFAGEEEFAEVMKTSHAAIASLDKKIYLAEKERYLKDHFRSLFQQNYPAAISENLTNPQVSLVKESEGKLIFKMQCQESGQGRPLTLVMFYAYDKGENRWNFHSEQ